MSLWRDFLTNDDRVAHKWKHYFPAYERHFSRFVYTDVVFIEIGCGKGGSLQMWKRYFGPHARIVGVDINPTAREFAEDQIEIRIGDQADGSFLAGIVEEFGSPDIVLDDGSHVVTDQVASFKSLYPRMTRTGVYAVEDLHTSYWRDHGGGLRHPGSFVELVKEHIDLLNADHSRGALPATDFTRSTLSIHCYDSMVFFERGRHTDKRALLTGRAVAP